MDFENHKSKTQESSNELTKEQWDLARKGITNLAQSAYDSLPDEESEREWFEARRSLCERADEAGIDVHKCFAWHDAIGGSAGFNDAPVIDLPNEFSLEEFYRKTIKKFSKNN